MHKKLYIVSLFFLLAGMVSAQKVVYIDMQYILKNLPQYETANEQLQMNTKRWQREIDAAAEELRVMQANYQTEQIFLSDELKTKREQEILDKEKTMLELKRKYFAQDGEYFKKRESLLKPIQDEIYAVVQEIAQERHYDVVKDRSGDLSLIYMSSKLDISDLVLQKLGAK